MYHRLRQNFAKRKMKTMQLYPIDSGDYCPETGIYYSNYHIKDGAAIWESAQKFYQYEVLPELNAKPTKWTYFIELS